VTLDTGALIAADRQDRSFWAFWKAALKHNTRFFLPAACLAQAWRNPTSAAVALVAKATTVLPLDERLAKLSGTLCGKARTADVVDAAVVGTAAFVNSDAILTSDPRDLKALVTASGRPLKILDLATLGLQ